MNGPNLTLVCGVKSNSMRSSWLAGARGGACAGGGGRARAPTLYALCRASVRGAGREPTLYARGGRVSHPICMVAGSSWYSLVRPITNYIS